MELHAANSWLFCVPARTQIYIKNKEIFFNDTLKGTGIIIADPDTMINTEMVNIKVPGHKSTSANIKFTSMNLDFMPFNISCNSLINIKIPSAPSLINLESHEKFLELTKDMEDLEVKEKKELLKITMNHATHYWLGFLSVCTLGLICFMCCKCGCILKILGCCLLWRSNHKSSSTKKTSKLDHDIIIIQGTSPTDQQNNVNVETLSNSSLPRNFSRII